ncbi:MAG TPA: adenylate/guanylate cyclase domain-containing protein [Stellaceae bacterium]|nr:adenylate/guanylate cyclase domain-containing protein [Stellaceae bacterium]
MNEISLWLESIGLGQYASVFIRENIDLHILPTLADDDLRELGLSLGHRRIFLRAMQKLTAQNAGNETQPWPPLREGQRRQLTLLFCDMIDSTRLAARLDPEDLREVVSTYRLACTLPIKRYDGFVARFIGDGLLAYFGYPQAHEDDSERAIRAGLGIVDAMADLNAGFGSKSAVELSVRIGVATGFVVVGDIEGGPREQDAVMGEAPNLAARLQGLASPNAIVVANETKQLVGDRFEFRDLGEVSLKGIDKPTQAWQVLFEKIESRFSARGAQLVPLVNREMEIGLLQESWQAALLGKGGAVLLRGEAGIGKSRIVAAFREQSADDPGTAPARTLSFQCSPFHSNTSLYPIIRELERQFALAGAETAEQKLDKLRSLASGPDDEIALLADLIPLRTGRPASMPAMGPTEKRGRTLDALVRWFGALTLAGPVLLIFEDLQWLDPTSELLLQRLVGWAESSRALIIATLRAGASSGRDAELRPGAAPATWSTSPHVKICDLLELGERESTHLLAAVAKGRSLPAPVVETLLRKAEGNPLYIEELTKGWVESASGRAHDRGSSARVQSTVGIPSTLMDALMSRLDQAGSAHEVAQHAAVIGHDFSLDLLSTVSNLPAPRLQDGLEALLKSDIVTRVGSPSKYTYQFKHALLQDAAYRSLLRSRRREIHFKIAEKLDRDGRGSASGMDEVIAQHYALGGAPREAIACWRRAAEQAFIRSAHTEAANLLQCAIDVLDEVTDPPERMRLELDLTLELAAALRSIYGYAAPIAEEQYLKARELSQRTGDSSRRFNIEWGLMQCNYVKGEMDATTDIVAGLFEHAQYHPDRPYVDAHLAEGMVQFQIGDFEAARRAFERGVALSRPETDHPHFFTHGQNPGTFCASFLAYTLWFLGYPDRAKAMIESNLAIARARTSDSSHVHSFVSALTYAVRIHQNRGDAALTKQFAEELVVISRRNHYNYYEALAITHLGWANAVEQSLRAGIEQMKEGLAAIINTGTVNTLPGFYARLAELYVRLGRSDKALRVLGKAKARNCRAMLFWDAEIERVRGEAFLIAAPADPEAAETAFLSSLEIARRQKARSLELRAVMSYARLLKSRDARQAHELLQSCLSTFDEGAETLDLIEARGLARELAF